MKFPWQQSTWESTIKANIALSIANLALTGALFMAVGHSLFSKPDTVLVPPVVDEKMVIGENSASQSYLKSFGLYVATLIGNITPSNASFIVDSISSFISPSIYPQIRKTILATAQSTTFKDAAMTTKFVPRQVIYEPDTDKVFVLGDSTVLSSVGAQSARSLVYEMVIKIQDKKPVVYTLDAYEGTQPHTLQWIKEHPPTPPQTSGDKQ